MTDLYGFGPELLQLPTKDLSYCRRKSRWAERQSWWEYVVRRGTELEEGLGSAEAQLPLEGASEEYTALREGTGWGPAVEWAFELRSQRVKSEILWIREKGSDCNKLWGIYSSLLTTKDSRGAGSNWNDLNLLPCWQPWPYSLYLSILIWKGYSDVLA